jgi:DNA (cytosine-5)-methyltransferase 1
MVQFRFIDLFSGLGGIRIPFEEAGGTCVLSSDIDPHAQMIYEKNFGHRPLGDITLVQEKSIPDHDILLAGFPCQPFSIIGKGLGFADTRGTLFFDIERILRAKKPEAFLLENVKRLTSHDKGRTLRVIIEKLKNLGYNVHWKVLNAMDYGLPQKRERVIIVGFKDRVHFTWPDKQSSRLQLVDVLEPHTQVETKHFVSENIRINRYKKVNRSNIPKPGIWHENKSGNVSVNEFSCAIRAGASYNYLLVDGIRRLTPRELLRLQGFSDDYNICVSDAQARRLAGNSVPINLIRAVSKNMLLAMYGKYNNAPVLIHQSTLELYNGRPDDTR